MTKKPVTRGLASPNRDKRRKIMLLRGMLVVAVGGLLLDAGLAAAGVGALALVLAFALSDALLPLVPPRFVRTLRFELLVGATDLVLVGLGIHLAGAGSGALPISCLLMVLVVALGNYKSHMVAGAAAVTSMHAWLILNSASGTEVGRQLLLQTLFLCSVGLYYGSLTEGIHRYRRAEAAEGLERRELSALIEILESITSSLDVREVTAAIVSKLASVVPAVRCSIVYINESMTRGYVMASHDDPELSMLELDLGRYPEIRKAIKTRDRVVVQDVLSDPLMAEVRELIEPVDLQSVVVIPLTFVDDLLGTLVLRSARDKQRFMESEIKFCHAVARASANALKNAVLHRQVLEESGQRRRTGEKLGRILNHSPELILTTKPDGRITEFNRGAERLLGYQKEELLGEPFRVLLGEGEDENLVQRVCSMGMLPSHACRLKRKDGSELEMELHLSVLEDDAEHVMGTVWIGRDITALKSAQLQLLQAEKLSSIGEVISGVAHELNNPLSAVLGFSQLIMSRHGDNPIAGELEKIHHSALRCQKIVKNLLSFARKHKPERKYLGLNGILEKTLELKKYHLHVNNITLVKDLEPDLPYTMLDFHQMQQVFLNLINNAQHAMMGTRDRPGCLVARTSSERRRIRAEIVDNGEGMSHETMKRIFDPFFTTKPQGEGTGLGLSVSYGIVKEHGGRIYARSRKGEGTCFVVELPVIKEDEHHEADAREQAGPSRAETTERGRILVVDDEPMILDLLVDILEDAGHRVDTASNGNEACRKVSSSGYDMVITDVRMPEMNGLDLYRNILSTRPELEGRVVFITGDLMDSETVQFLGDVKAPTIPKPLDIFKVAEMVRQTLRAG